MNADDIRRATTRVAHEIVERNGGIDNLALIALQTGGVAFAHALAQDLQRIEGTEVVLGTLDVANFRDDAGVRSMVPSTVTDIPFDLTGMRVVVVDDVLFTGRTVRAALNALNSHGRAESTQLAVMVDRGHRELPIRPDYVGKNLPTRRDEQVAVDVTKGVTIGDVQPK
jgi:pyrimidine operon attenuation protein / uracil phosphoribosyltransferase